MRILLILLTLSAVACGKSKVSASIEKQPTPPPIEEPLAYSCAYKDETTGSKCLPFVGCKLYQKANYICASNKAEVCAISIRLDRNEEVVNGCSDSSLALDSLPSDN